MQETKIRNIKRKCPYCFREVSNSQVGFLLKTEGARFQSPALNEFAAVRPDLPYIYFWNAMGVPEDRIDGRRCIIDNQALTVLNQELSSSGADLARKQYDEASCGYTFLVEEGAVTLFSNTMVCPYCHNELPQNFFRYEMLMVGLAGSVASGKTVYLCSLMMNDYDVMQRDNLTVRSAAGNPSDPERLEMEKNADRLFVDGICPAGTSKIFRKPVFMELNYRLPDSSIFLLVAVYDVAGELIRESTGMGRTGFVRHMDGFICLVDPAQMHLNHALFSRQMPDEDQVLRRLHLMTLEEQMSIQRLSNENEKQVFGGSDYLLEQTSRDEFFYERKIDTVLDALRSTLGEKLLSEKYIALTIGKSDLLEGLGEILEYKGSSLLFERGQVACGFMDMDRHFLRQQVLRKIFDQKVFRLQRKLNDYKAASLFAVSALGCETEEQTSGDQQLIRAVGKVRPIRVEEPFMWILMKYMQERGWLQ